MKKIDQKYYVLKKAYEDLDESIVKINYEEIKKLNFNNIKEEGLSENEVQALKGKSIDEVISFLLALNSINYQYWDTKEGIFSRYSNNGQVGALAAYEGFINLWNDYKNDSLLINKLNIDLLTHYFGDIPQKETRIELLKESLNYNNTINCVEYIKQSLDNGVIDTETAYEIAEILPKSFKEPYLKKIQLALYEITLQARVLGYKVEESLTVAADYQLPKVMEAMGIISYSNELSEKINNKIELPYESKEEVAIRAATIIACEAIASEHNVSIPSIDRWLWLARNDYKNKNFHLTKTTAY